MFFLQGENIPYDGDPLNDFTLLRFLDQFVHKNPKQNKGDHGGSLMQPMGNLLRTQGYRLPSEGRLWITDSRTTLN